MLEMRARAKFDSWASRRGMHVDEAKEEYVDYVDELLG
jgi:acyl-CoA-binding protein